MKKYFVALAVALLLSGCDGAGKPAGYYLVDEIRIEFAGDTHGDNNTEGEEERLSLQAGITQSVEKEKDDIYFNFTPTEAIYYTTDGKQTKSIENGRMQINDVWRTVEIDGKNAVRLVSDKGMTCGFYDCEITMVLKKRRITPPR